MKKIIFGTALSLGCAFFNSMSAFAYQVCQGNEIAAAYQGKWSYEETENNVNMKVILSAAKDTAQVQVFVNGEEIKAAAQTVNAYTCEKDSVPYIVVTAEGKTRSSPVKVEGEKLSIYPEITNENDKPNFERPEIVFTKLVE